MIIDVSRAMIINTNVHNDVFTHFGLFLGDCGSDFALPTHGLSWEESKELMGFNGVFL